MNKAFAIQVREFYDEDKERFYENYVILELTVVGQHYQNDSEGYGFPEYTYQITERAAYKTIEECKVYIDACGGWMNAGAYNMKHPTSVSSCGDVGDYPLDERVSKKALFRIDPEKGVIDL